MYPKLWMWISYILIALEINNYIVYKYMCVCVCVYILYVEYLYTLQVHMYSSGIVVHYIGWGCQSPNSEEIHSFKWEFCVQFAWLFPECNPGINQDLPVPKTHTCYSLNSSRKWLSRLYLHVAVEVCACNHYGNYSNTPSMSTITFIITLNTACS